MNYTKQNVCSSSSSSSFLAGIIIILHSSPQRAADDALWLTVVTCNVYNIIPCASKQKCVCVCNNNNNNSDKQLFFLFLLTISALSIYRVARAERECGVCAREQNFFVVVARVCRTTFATRHEQKSYNIFVRQLWTVIDGCCCWFGTRNRGGYFFLSFFFLYCKKSTTVQMFIITGRVIESHLCVRVFLSFFFVLATRQEPPRSRARDKAWKIVAEQFVFFPRVLQ